jgi:acetoin utilization protein AcuB
MCLPRPIPAAGLADKSDMPLVPDICLGQIMTRRIVTVSMDDSLRKVRELFDTHGFHHLLVVERGKLIGVISDRDLLRSLSPFLGHEFSERPQDAATLNKRVHQIMTRRLVTGSEQTPVVEAMRMILDHQVSCLPVVDACGQPIGIVTWRDLLNALAAPVDAHACGSH